MEERREEGKRRDVGPTPAEPPLWRLVYWDQRNPRSRGAQTASWDWDWVLARCWQRGSKSSSQNRGQVTGRNQWVTGINLKVNPLPNQNLENLPGFWVALRLIVIQPWLIAGSLSWHTLYPYSASLFCAGLQPTNTRHIGRDSRGNDTCAIKSQDYEPTPAPHPGLNLGDATLRLN